MGIILFRHYIIRNPSVNKRFRAILLSNIQNERCGEHVNRENLRHILSLLVDVCLGNLEVYTADFENDFISATRTFYTTEARAFLQQNSIPDYLRKVQCRLDEEEKRGESILHRASRAKLKEACIDVLVSQQASLIVEEPSSGVRPMLREARVTDLRLLYNLFILAPKGTLDGVLQEMSHMVKATGTR